MVWLAVLAEVAKTQIQGRTFEAHQEADGR
jgi:hypothetical protein